MISNHTGMAKLILSILLFPTLFQQLFLTFAWGAEDQSLARDQRWVRRPAARNDGPRHPDGHGPAVGRFRLGVSDKSGPGGACQSATEPGIC